MTKAKSYQSIAALSATLLPSIEEDKLEDKTVVIWILIQMFV